MASRCSSCQVELRTGARFCSECGAPVGPDKGGSAGELEAPATDAAEPSAGRPPVAEPDGALDPAAAYLLEVQSEGKFRPWLLRRPYYSVGRDGAKIALADPGVSPRHLAVARVGEDWLVINRSYGQRMRVNGWELCQKTLRHGDAVRIGNTWLVFAAARPPGKAEPPAEGKAAAQCSLFLDGKPVASSAGEPLLIGRHPLCGVPVAAEKVAALHCLLSWLPDGLHVIDLDSDRGTILDGKRVRERVVRDGQAISVGGKRLTVRLKGDPAAPAAERVRRAQKVPPAVGLSVIFGPHAGATALLPEGKQVLLGRAEGADLRLSGEARLAPRHLELTLEPLAGGAIPPTVQIRDVGKRGDVLVNRKPMAGASAVTIGDVIQFGTPQKVAPTTLLIHYDLKREGW